MEEQKFKLMKVFDCDDMPPDVKKKFFKNTEKGNDCYVDWPVHESVKLVGITDQEKGSWLKSLDEIMDGEILFEEVQNGIRSMIQRGDDIISDWLFDNGAKMEERVLIKHSW